MRLVYMLRIVPGLIWNRGTLSSYIIRNVVFFSYLNFII